MSIFLKCWQLSLFNLKVHPYTKFPPHALSENHKLWQKMFTSSSWKCYTKLTYVFKKTLHASLQRFITYHYQTGTSTHYQCNHLVIILHSKNNWYNLVPYKNFRINIIAAPTPEVHIAAMFLLLVEGNLEMCIWTTF